MYASHRPRHSTRGAMGARARSGEEAAAVATTTTTTTFAAAAAAAVAAPPQSVLDCLSARHELLAARSRYTHTHTHTHTGPARSADTQFLGDFACLRPPRQTPV